MPLNIPFGVHFVDMRNHLVDNQNAANTRKIKKNLRIFAAELPQKLTKSYAQRRKCDRIIRERRFALLSEKGDQNEKNFRCGNSGL